MSSICLCLSRSSCPSWRRADVVSDSRVRRAWLISSLISSGMSRLQESPRCNHCASSIAFSLAFRSSSLIAHFCSRRSSSTLAARTVSLSILSCSFSISSSSFTFLSTHSSINSDCAPFKPPVLKLCRILSLASCRSIANLSLVSRSPLIFDSDSSLTTPLLCNCRASRKLRCSLEISLSSWEIFSSRLSFLEIRFSNCLTIRRSSSSLKTCTFGW